MSWSFILTVIEALNSTRRNEFTLINALCIDQTAAFFMRNSLLIHSESTDLLFRTVVENEIMTIYSFNEKHIQRQKRLCKNEHSNDSKKTFNVRTAVHKRCWIEFVFWIIFFIWFLQNKDEKNNSTIQLLLYNFLKAKSRNDLFFQIKSTFNDFIKTFHTNQFISLYQVFCSQISKNTIKCNESTFRSSQQLVCSIVR